MLDRVYRDLSGPGRRGGECRSEIRTNRHPDQGAAGRAAGCCRARSIADDSEIGLISMNKEQVLGRIRSTIKGYLRRAECPSHEFNASEASFRKCSFVQYPAYYRVGMPLLSGLELLSSGPLTFPVKRGMVTLPGALMSFAARTDTIVRRNILASIIRLAF